MVIDWDPIEKACIAGMSFKEASQVFHVKYNSIRRRAARHHWPTPKAISKRVDSLTKPNDAALQASAELWLTRGSDQREVAFRLGHESLKKMKPRAPANFREAEIADRIARRAAGLDVSDATNQTLIQINEAMSESPVELAVGDSVPGAGPDGGRPALDNNTAV